MNSVSCKKTIEEISGYFDGDLDPELKAALEAHLKMCHDCRMVFDTTRKTIELYCDGKLFPLPDDVRDRLHQALQRTWQEKAK